MREMNETIDSWMYQRGYRLVLTDVFVDQIIAEEGSSHADGSHHDYDVMMTASGFINKCILCGDELPPNNLSCFPFSSC